MQKVALLLYVGGPQKTGFSLKRRFIYISNKKLLIPFKILSIGGNTLVQSFFPLCVIVYCYIYYLNKS